MFHLRSGFKLKKRPRYDAWKSIKSIKGPGLTGHAGIRWILKYNTTYSTPGGLGTDLSQRITACVQCSVKLENCLCTDSILLSYTRLSSKQPAELGSKSYVLYSTCMHATAFASFKGPVGQVFY